MNRLLSVSEAQGILLEAFEPVGVVPVSSERALGRVLAKDIYSPMDLPSFDNSTMDGFAVRANDLVQASRESPISLQIVGDIAAGQNPDFSIGEGQAAQIMTGAPIPHGADGVIPVEDTDFMTWQPGSAELKQVQFYRPIKTGENIRLRGQDVPAGRLVLHSGIRMRPQEVGFLSMIGVAETLVYRKPRIALLSTGDELLPLNAAIRPGKIYDSNSSMLAALVMQYGGEPVNLGIVADKTKIIEEFLDRAIESQVDLILSSAGVSVGVYDYVRSVVERNGRLTFWRVNMRPGKPLAFGSYRNVPFIGLPGNPVSAFVGFEVFVRPALLKLAGLKEWRRPTQKVILADSVESDGRESYLRGVIKAQADRKVAYLTGHQGSGNLYSLVQANALLIIPSGVKSLPVGAEIEAWMLDQSIPGGLPG